MLQREGDVCDFLLFPRAKNMTDSHCASGCKFIRSTVFWQTRNSILCSWSYFRQERNIRKIINKFQLFIAQYTGAPTPEHTTEKKRLQIWYENEYDSTHPFAERIMLHKFDIQNYLKSLSSKRMKLNSWLVFGTINIRLRMMENQFTKIGNLISPGSGSTFYGKRYFNHRPLGLTEYKLCKCPEGT